jgi:hypothetical protein
MPVFIASVACDNPAVFCERGSFAALEAKRYTVVLVLGFERIAILDKAAAATALPRTRSVQKLRRSFADTTYGFTSLDSFRSIKSPFSGLAATSVGSKCS